MHLNNIHPLGPEYFFRSYFGFDAREIEEQIAGSVSMSIRSVGGELGHAAKAIRDMLLPVEKGERADRWEESNPITFLGVELMEIESSDGHLTLTVDATQSPFPTC